MSPRRRAQARRQRARLLQSWRGWARRQGAPLVRLLRSRRDSARRGAYAASRAAARLRFSAYLLVQPVLRRNVRVLVPSMLTVSSPLARAMNLAARLGTRVDLFVLDFTIDTSRATSTLAELSEPVVVHRFWRDAAIADGGAPPRHCTTTLTEAPLPDAATGPPRTGYFHEGRLVLATVDTGGGTAVEYYDHAGMLAYRDELDGRGMLVRIVDLHPGTGRAVTHRYLDSGGRCWLSVWVDPVDGTLGRTHQHRPTGRQFDDLRAAQAAWVAESIGQDAGSRRARIVTLGEEAEAVARLLDAPHAATISARYGGRAHR